MKKGLLLSLLFVLVVVVTGCGSKESAKILTCTMKGTVIEGTDIESTYKVTYTGKYVDLVESVETVKSDSQEILESYKETVEKMYSPYKDVKYYEYNIDLKDDTLTSKATINYAKIDTAKMLEINSANSTMIKDGKVAISTLKQVYENMGATCK